MEIRLGEKAVGGNAPVLIIAEAGVNHNGDLELAYRLVDTAVQAGADAVKFQTFRADRVASAAAPKAAYQQRTTGSAESQLDMLRRLELSHDAHRKLQAYCGSRGILFLSTPFDTESADLLDDLGVPAFKIGSGEITNLPFLEHIAAKQKPVILSTGMAYLGEVDAAVRAVRAAGCDRLILLHATSNYPADPADANLRAMQTLAAAFRVPVGYSDHTPGIEVPLAAVAMGACVLEKHFTLDRNMPGPDQAASLEPGDLCAMVAAVRKVEAALGDGIKAPAASEENTRMIARRSLAAAIDIPCGAVLEPCMLAAVRPATGLPPTLLDQVVHRTVKRGLRAGELLRWGDLE